MAFWGLLPLPLTVAYSSRVLDRTTCCTCHITGLWTLSSQHNRVLGDVVSLAEFGLELAVSMIPTRYQPTLPTRDGWNLVSVRSVVPVYEPRRRRRKDIGTSESAYGRVVKPSIYSTCRYTSKSLSTIE
ncbi:hypothetical protein F5Y03DRAFT_365984 [Xylaria venustula]|nr:hypothetical protein F5Y03DRAFT_365984 [Xylaria venustula]